MHSKHGIVLAPKRLPIIDIATLVAGSGDQAAVASQIGQACREDGFFYITGHGVDPALAQRLEAQSRAFFAQPDVAKMRIRMALGGRAWRGYFPLGGELTSGVPDDKEGLYFGEELADDDPRVLAETPLHGRNLFPEIPGMRETVLAWMAELTRVAQAVLRGIALSLGLDADYFHERYTHDPLILFRIFNYPGTASRQATDDHWGVGEHTDYGVLTLLKQDSIGGLQVRSRRGWIDAPPVDGTFVCNIGDMLDRMTRGLYRSTPHRVFNSGARDRLSFPFFFDPGFDSEVKPIETVQVKDWVDDRGQRWDRASVHAFEGTYGDYVLAKVARVFPALRRTVSHD